MKKVSVLILVLIIILSLIGCNNKNASSKTDSFINGGSENSNNESVKEDGSSDIEFNNNTSTDEKSEIETDNNLQQNNESNPSGNSDSSNLVNNNPSSQGSGNGGDSTSSDTSSAPSSGSDGTVDSENHGNSDNASDNSSANNSSVQNNSQPNSSVDKEKCKHSYSEKIIPPTCTKQGYSQFTCSKCNDSYKDEYVPAKHVFIDYVCSQCGIGDDEYGYKALKTWIKKNHVEGDNQNGNGGLERYIYEFETDDGKYTLESITTGNITLSFISSDSKEQLEIEIYDTENCNVNFILLDGKPIGDALISKKDITLSDGKYAEKFTAPDGMDAEEFKTKFCGRINSTLIFLNDEILAKNLQLTIDNLGFVTEVQTLPNPENKEISE